MRSFPVSTFLEEGEESGHFMPLLRGLAVMIGTDAAQLCLLWLTPSKSHRLKIPSGRDLGGLCQHNASLGHVSEKCSLCQYRDVSGNSLGVG